MNPSRAAAAAPRSVAPHSVDVRLPGTAATSPMPLRVKRLDSYPSIASALNDLPTPAASAGFQTPGWINAVYRHLVPACGNTPLAVALHAPDSTELLGVVPLYVRQQNGLRIARFADCGVTDYNAPLLADLSSRSPASLLESLKPALGGIDVLMLERMLVSPSNPLSLHPAARTSRMSGNTLTIIDTVDDFVRSRGKKFRKEVERCFRVLESEGTWSFQRAHTASEIAEAFTALERQQAERHAGKGDSYELAAPQYGAFYREVLNASSDLGHIFTLTVDGTVIAVLMGITHNGTFTLLRTANGGEAWRHVSPGRLIVIEAMRHFCAQGVKTFDMGIGDYAFKRGFGNEPIALADLIVPLSWRAIPYVTSLRLKDRLRKNERLVETVRTVKARLNALRA